jgi:PAS domain S-box-containing protein
MAQRPTIRQRLRTAVLVPTAIAVALSCIVFVLLEWRSTRREHEQRLLTVAAMLAENVSSSIAFKNPEDGRKVLASLRTERAVRDAVVFDEKGKSFAQYRAPDATRPLPSAPGPLGVVEEDGRLTVFHAVMQDDRRYGTLFVRWDLRPWYAEMRKYMVGALGILAACLSAAWLVSHLLRGSFVNPILDLAETTREIGQNKNYTVRARVPETEELAALADAFNQMLHETQQVQSKLADEIEATRRAEQQLRLVTDATPGLISYIGTDERYRFVNRQYELWFNRRQEEVLGRTMEEVLGATAMASLRPHFHRALAGEPAEFESQVAYREGGTRWIHAHYLPHRATSGEVLGVFVLVLDMTERKRMEDSLARAHAELARHNQTLETTVQERTARMREVIGELEAFSYSIAHDMRAPLRSMQGFSRLLVEEHAAQLDEDGKSYLRRIRASADRLDRLIQDVLDYSRVVRQELRMEKVDTKRLLDEIVATYPNLQSAQADIRVEGEIPPVWANPAALTQVVSNLLGNAVKFVKPGTRPAVRVSGETFSGPNGTGVPARWVRLSIVDNGIGIPKEAQHRLFAMFQRLHRPELYEGTGMGLAIVRKAVERMGGRLGVESEEGRGSRFWVELKAEES